MDIIIFRLRSSIHFQQETLLLLRAFAAPLLQRGGQAVQTQLLLKLPRRGLLLLLLRLCKGRWTHRLGAAQGPSRS